MNEDITLEANFSTNLWIFLSNELSDNDDYRYQFLTDCVWFLHKHILS
jgi:hypothetical protein